MPTKWEKWLIKLFIDGYNREFQASYKLVEPWPDEEDRAKRLPDQPQNIDALAKDRAGRTLAIEHTRIEAFKDATRNDAHFRAVSDALKDPSLRLPGYQLIVYIRIDLMAGLSGGERRRLAAEMKEWFRATSRDLPVGQSRHMPILCGREWAITTYKSHLARHAGSVALRRYPKPPFLPRLRKALKDKVDKLAEYKSDHHILLLERQDYDTPDQWKLAAALKSLKRTHKHKLSRLDEVEVWMADLTCLWMGDGGNAWFHSAWPDNGLDFVQENVKGFAREA